MADTIEPHVMPTYARGDEVFVDGAGAVVRDQDGNEFLDFLSGIAVTALGHAHPALTEALRDQVGRVTHLSNLFRHPYTADVSARLCAHASMRKAFFTNSGAESVECALKLARKAQHLAGRAERTSFVALEGGFHGRTMGALSLTHAAPYRAPFGPLLEVRWVPRGDVDALERALREARPAGLVLEPIQGEGGIHELPGEFLRAARALCDETGTVLIHDEVQSGCGRTGRFLAAQHHDVTPDVVALAKPLGAGVPMGACLAAEAFADVLQPGDHGTTFGGGPLACRAAGVFLDELEGGLLEDVRARGHQLREGLEDIAAASPAVREVRGRGLMLGVQLDRPAKDAHCDLYGRRLILNTPQADVLRIVPPFVVTSAQVDEALAHIRAVLTALPAAPAPQPQTTP
ncbi:MAG: aspartate aminotransferase family protein [Planctomycetota bacterium]